MRSNSGQDFICVTGKAVSRVMPALPNRTGKAGSKRSIPTLPDLLGNGGIGQLGGQSWKKRKRSMLALPKTPAKSEMNGFQLRILFYVTDIDDIHTTH